MAKKSMYDSTAQVVWRDRKRYFGLPLSFTRYEIIKEETIFLQM